MSIRKGSTTIAASVPTTEWGGIEGNITDQADLKNLFDSSAPLYSPTFTGTPTAPTAASGTNNNQIATTKFVNNALANVDALPDQSGQSGKFLSTNGTSPSWTSISANSEIEWATYGITTYQQVKDWYDSSKVVFCNYNSSIYVLTLYLSYDKFLFISNHNLKNNYLQLSISDTWSSGVDNIQTQLPAGTAGQVLTYTGTAGSVGAATIVGLPDQLGQSGKFLSTNGTTASWVENSEYKNYIASREENLITNGFLSLKNNYNFSEFTFDSSDLNNSSSGCITSTDVNASKYFDEKIYVDITKGYIFKYDIKTNNASASFIDRFVSYDVDDNLIANNQCSWIENTTTTLTQKIQDGDTVIHLSDVSDFTNDTTGLIIWNYSNSNGYTYPKETYSRNVYTNLWSSISDIDTVNNTITLTEAWSNGEVANGTFVSQCSDDTSTTTNIHNAYLISDGVWVTKKAYITPSKFKQGTAYIKIGWNFNKNVGAATTKWTNISLSRDADCFNTELLGIPTAPTAQSGTSTTQIATTEFVSNAISSSTLTGDKFISITNNKIDYTGTQLFKLATRSLTYAQWIASYERGVSSTTTASYTITGLRIGDFVTVEGICTDRGNISVLANGVVTAINGTSVTATYYGLLFQNEGNVVHTSGDETIAGAKTFSSNVYASSPVTNSPNNTVTTVGWVKDNFLANSNTSAVTAVTLYGVVDAGRNGTEWYREYSDGWVEQGGYVSSSGNVVFTKTMSDTNYSIQITEKTYGVNGSEKVSISNLSTTGFTTTPGNNDYNFYWEVKGMKASS